MYLTAPMTAFASSLPSLLLIFRAKCVRSIWSILVLLAYSRVLFLAAETSAYCLLVIILLMDLANAASLEGTVAESSARSVMDSVSCWACPTLAQADT